MTIEESKLDKEKLEKDISNLLHKYEQKYGVNTILSLEIKRWDGSSNCCGDIVGTKLRIELI